MSRGLISDEEWAVFAGFLDVPGEQGGRPPKDHRRVLYSILWIARTGAPWRDIPAEFGKWNSVAQQFRHWSVRRVGCGAAIPCRQRQTSRLIADDRQHHDPGTSLCRRHKRGTQNEALGRSRGGFSTKIHLRTNAAGLPVAAVLTGGETHDVKAYDDLMDERESDPGALLADKGYDRDAIRRDRRDRGAAPEIPTKSNREMLQCVDTALYAIRSRIECCIGHLKEQRRVATRFDKTKSSFLGFVLLASIRLWLRFVHRA